jgi:hypothetical protein
MLGNKSLPLLQVFALLQLPITALTLPQLWCLEAPEEPEERQDSTSDEESLVMSVQEISQDKSSTFTIA